MALMEHRARELSFAVLAIDTLPLALPNETGIKRKNDGAGKI